VIPTETAGSRKLRWMRKRADHEQYAAFQPRAARKITSNGLPASATGKASFAGIDGTHRRSRHCVGMRSNPVTMITRLIFVGVERDHYRNPEYTSKQ
jgi:hypothetical protein